ncbi:MAG: transporter [Tyzzerella sp.]|nr:transporter [Tyzzerella sp.]
MKQITYALTSIFLFFVMLCFPKETLSGATDGLLLWFQIVMPTLLPFFILTNFLIHTNSIKYISQICGPVLQKLFRVSPNGSFAVLAGFLCGYPIGAKVTADLVKTDRISLSEGKYLLSFCNNTSPAFITSYIVIQNFKEEELLFPTLLILYLSPILCSFLFRRIYKIPSDISKQTPNQDSSIRFGFEIVDECIMNSFENITKIGGYIMLFSILFSLGRKLPIAPVLPILEITTGIPKILKTYTNFKTAYVLVLALTSFGGLCAVAQSNSMLNGTKLSITTYTIQKLITAGVTSLFAFTYITMMM